MSEALKLMKHLESIGHGLMMEGESLRIVRGKNLPPSLLDEISTHKKQILSIFRQDAEAKATHFIIGISGTLYMRTLNRFSTVYLECENDKWSAWRETYKPGHPSSSSSKTIVLPSSFGAAIEEVEKYFQYIEHQRKRIS